MKNFEYAQPRTEAEALELLTNGDGQAEVLAGGTDLVALMKSMVVAPDRVVDIGQIDSLQSIHHDSMGQLVIGAGIHLDDLIASALVDPFPAVKQAAQGINSLQLQAQGTVGGELLRRPECWYFRDGYGLLADRGQRVIEGDNRYHAVLGNRGPAKFVNASRLAPALISLGAKLRIAGPASTEERIVPVEQLYQTPADDSQRENVLKPGQLVTHVILPPDRGLLSAAYEVRQSEGPDSPLAAAAATLEVVNGVVEQARIVLGQVAPIPWISAEAERALVGHSVNPDSAERAGQAAVASAMPLSNNEYKIQLATVAVKRAVLRAAGSNVGGF